jgi:hypothetical protein
MKKKLKIAWGKPVRFKPTVRQSAIGNRQSAMVSVRSQQRPGAAPAF